ncbi:MAG: FecR family protein [Candidatus Binatia bacterium]
MRRNAIAFLLPLILVATVAVAAEPAGRVKNVAGKTILKSGTTSAPAKVGDAVAMGDVVETGADGSVGITFRDASRVSVGPNSKMVIDEFVFSPKTEDYGLTTRLQEGTLFYVSGLIAKLAPQNTSVATPDGTIGIRGTRLLVSVRK